jgi:hypothetical protein
MIGGPRLCEPLLATGLGRFTGAASKGSPDERNDLRDLSRISLRSCGLLAHSGFQASCCAGSAP